MKVMKTKKKAKKKENRINMKNNRTKNLTEINYDKKYI